MLPQPNFRGSEARVKDIYQVLREKELAVARVRQEVEALRFCAPMLAEATEPSLTPGAPTNGTSTNRWPADRDSGPSTNPHHN
jgi:hypothetical protein